MIQDRAYLFCMGHKIAKIFWKHEILALTRNWKHEMVIAFARNMGNRNARNMAKFLSFILLYVNAHSYNWNSELGMIMQQETSTTKY